MELEVTRYAVDGDGIATIWLCRPGQLLDRSVARRVPLDLRPARPAGPGTAAGDWLPTGG